MQKTTLSAPLLISPLRYFHLSNGVDSNGVDKTINVFNALDEQAVLGDYAMAYSDRIA